MSLLPHQLKVNIKIGSRKRISKLNSNIYIYFKSLQQNFSRETSPATK